MPVKREKIEKWSLLYHLLKLWVDFLFRSYYRVRVIGAENINFDRPAIFAANHQNALMDALAILASRKWQPVFLARSDVFAGKFLTKVLTFFKMLPVYRIRDGFSTLQQNDAIFDKTIDVLKNNNGLVLFPEGTHLAEKRLRQLKKGMARIAFQAEEAEGGKLGIQIVPLGLEYEDYHKEGSHMLIRFGKPVFVSDYLHEWRENPGRIQTQLIRKISECMIDEMIHLDDEVHFGQLHFMTEIMAVYGEKATNSYRYKDVFESKQQAARRLMNIRDSAVDKYSSLLHEASKLEQLMKHNKISLNEVLKIKSKWSAIILRSLALLFSLPVFAYAALNTAISLVLPMLGSQKFQDPAFRTSGRFVFALISFPLFFAIQTLSFGLVFGFGWLTLLYFISLPFSAMFVFYWRRHFFDNFAAAKMKWLKVVRPSLFRELKKMIDELLKGL